MSVFQAGTVITEGFTSQDLIGIMDETFACLVSISSVFVIVVTDLL